MASSVASAPAIHLLASLPTRPPTPPREAGHDVDVSLKSALGRTQPIDAPRSLQTPPSILSPVSVATRSDVSSNRARKRVEWSSLTDYKDPPDYRDGARLVKSPLRSAPSGPSKPIKGILKPSSSPGPAASTLGIHPDGAVSHPHLIEMLESAVKQLAGLDRDSKLDAYMTLARALKTSNNLPDRVALQNKMSLFVQFIQRDLTARNETGSLDSSLANHALHLLITFLHFQAIASTIPTDFGIFIVDHAIRSFETPSMPKDVIRHLMQVVAFQNFPTKLMTLDRVGRLVTALHRIEHHFQNKSIVMSRIYIYKRLVKQARGAMIFHSDWLKDMFVDMLSTVKDIRNQAISLGTEAGFALRADKQLLRKAAHVFKTADGDESFIDFYIKRLQRMIKDKQASFVVPQIWSVVILFLRCPLDWWQFYNPWLTLVQDAFNMTDSLLRQEANHAWTRYACLSIIDSKVPPKTIGALCQPFMSQLRRKASSDEALKLRAIVLGGLCSLYYHAFAQGEEKYPNELIWDTAVQPVVTQLITMDIPGDCTIQAARILAGLLDVSTPRPSRNSDRIMDPAPLKPEELLPIDCKWVRRHCDKIFHTVGPILVKKFTDLANQESIVFRLWQVLVGSIAAASAKDIKVSDDTHKFLACTSSLLAKLWSRGCEGDGSARSKFFTSVKHFAQLLADGLSILPFTEKKSPVSTSLTFEPVATPLQSARKGERVCGGSRTPLQHLFVMLSAVPPGCADDEELADLFRSLFEPFLKGRTGKARAELARELMQLLPQNALSPFGPWLLAADNMKTCIEKSPVESGVDGGKPLGPAYRELVSHLERGLACHPSLPAAHWKDLFDLVSTSVFEELGDAGRALIVVEPLAKSILENGLSNPAVPSAMLTRVMTMIFDTANLPGDRKALDAARSRLWGVSLAAAKVASSDPFDNLYKLANLTMGALYDKVTEPDSPSEIDGLVESVFTFVERCLPLALVQTITNLQDGLCPWFQDERDQLRLREGSTISATMGRVCERLGIELSSHGRLERKDFDQLESLLTTALQSKNPLIATKAIEACSTLFEDEDLKCSDMFKSIISSLRPKAIRSATGDGQSSKKFDAQVLSAIRHAEEDSIIVVSPAISRPESIQSTVPGSSGSKQRRAKKRQLKVMNETDGKSSKKRNSSRPRHDNSQLQFAVIAPSSPPHDESQHFTRRQKEVRERQQKTASSYPEMGSERGSEPGEIVSKESNHVEKNSGSGDSARDATPDRATMFDDLIRSTPTPRRGQVFPMDDANDPPSSPPVPRPCPLLSEIQSRSKVNNSLDNWDFSSPTGSPVPGPEQAGQEAEPLPIPRACAVSPPRARTRTRSRGPSDSTAQETKKAMGSRNADYDGRVGAWNSVSVLAPTNPPATPPRRCSALLGQASDTPGSGEDEDEFMDARTSPDWSAPHPCEALEEDFDGGQDAQDMSYALSEGDEHGMIDLVIELESRPHELPPSDADDSPKTDCSWKETDRKRPQVLQESPSGPTTRRGSLRLASLAAASTSTDAQASSEARCKRKRGGPQHTDGGGKRRRSLDAARHTKEDERRDTSPPVPAGRTRMETRQSLRKQKQPAVDASATSRVDRDARDRRSHTKTSSNPVEEPTWQPVTESSITSQRSGSQQSPRAAGKATRRLTRRESKKSLNPSNSAGTNVGDAELGEEREQGDDDTADIMGTLRSGLEQLRKTALARDRMYELEDILMDMKRELYEAEKRGRPRSADERKRKGSTQT
ncbi:hypothetical protein XA68_13529 [Ophiocordyceps unilateralis]|uniref:Telomere-associated protein Rif1 N-terminal domain-containing protein n=1 Tax=Ophiocordyceps unilateralis TaxID=268505 RepID=A0A2A9PNL9_OPHUN|nr:hypothetical protein XA68_13529 [Ophiocordyceps unilateralis]